MRLEWSAEGETRRGNVESGRKTDYQILSHVWNEDFHTHSKCRSGVSHRGGSQTTGGTGWE